MDRPFYRPIYACGKSGFYTWLLVRATEHDFSSFWFQGEVQFSQVCIQLLENLPEKAMGE